MKALEGLPGEATAWILRAGRSSRQWDEALLRDELRRRGVPAPEVAIAWERDLYALAPRLAQAGGALLEIPGRSFDVLASLARAPWVQSSEEGRALLPIGRIHAGGILALDAAGALHRASYRRPTVTIADRPAIHLARAAVQGAAEDAGWMHLALGGRGGALAAALGLPALAAASDGLAGVWWDGGITLLEGDVDAPSAAVTHAYAAPSRVAALLDACRAQGLEGALVLGPHPITARPPMREQGACSLRVSLPHRPLHGRGQGWVGLAGGEGEDRIEQVVIVDGDRISESRWPERSEVAYVLAESIEGLSPEGTARLRSLGFQRDLRFTVGAEQLEAELARRGLPLYPAVLEIERRMGGLRLEVPGPGGFVGFGAYQMLTSPAAAEHEDVALESETLDGAGWPRVLRDGEVLIPVGAHRETTLYADPGGALIAHDWLDDQATVVAHDALALLERWLLDLEVARRRIAGASPE